MTDHRYNYAYEKAQQAAYQVAQGDFCGTLDLCLRQSIDHPDGITNARAVEMLVRFEHYCKLRAAIGGISREIRGITLDTPAAPPDALPPSSRQRIAGIVQHLVDERFPASHLDALFEIVKFFNWSKESEKAVFDFAKSLSCKYGGDAERDCARYD